ncbi:MAG: LysM peptidoglycan-binding domain-containing protein [Magnetovibrionaceae bacterium]
MAETSSSRLFAIAGIGLAIILVAIGLNFFLDLDDGSEDEPGPVAQSASDSGGGQGAVLEGPDATRPDPLQPSFDVVRVNPKGDAVIAGRAEPGSTVIILDGENELGRATADDRGEWVFIPEIQLEPGERQLSLRTEAPAGEEPRESEAALILVVPDPQNGDGAAQPVLALKVPKSGEGAPQLMQGPVVRDPSVELGINVVDYGINGELYVSGHAPPNSDIRLYLDNNLIGQVIAGETGDWSVSPSEPIQPGLYTLRADRVAPDGKVLSRAEIPFSRVDELPNMEPGSFVVVQPGNSLWRLARRTYGSGFAFTTIYEANRKQIRDPDLIYPGQIFEMPDPD